jgi:hypothetical protein
MRSPKKHRVLADTSPDPSSREDDFFRCLVVQLCRRKSHKHDEHVVAG